MFDCDFRINTFPRRDSSDCFNPYYWNILTEYSLPKVKDSIGENCLKNFSTLPDSFFTEKNDIDIYEKDGVSHIEIEVPGFKKEDIKITTEENWLFVKGERKCRNDKGVKIDKKFKLNKVDVSSVSASLENGILHITFKEIEKKVSTINIK